MSLSRGLYDLILTEAVTRSLEGIAPDISDLHDLDNAEVAGRLIEVLGRQLRSILDQVDAGDEGPAHAQFALVNGSLAHTRSGRHRTPAGPNTKAGRRYVESATDGWPFQLFVRVHTSDPYRACGPVQIASTEDLTGDRPMNITWTLGIPLPPKIFAEFSVLRAQA